MEVVSVETEMEHLEQRVVDLRLEIDQIWADQARAAFELVAVFIHRGTASSGHYFVYLKSQDDGNWYKCESAPGRGGFLPSRSPS